jgi:hypothetical protein
VGYYISDYRAVHTSNTLQAGTAQYLTRTCARNLEVPNRARAGGNTKTRQKMGGRVREGKGVERRGGGQCRVRVGGEVVETRGTREKPDENKFECTDAR